MPSLGGLQARIVRWRSVFGGTRLRLWFREVCRYVSIKHRRSWSIFYWRLLFAFGCDRGTRSPHVSPMWHCGPKVFVPR